MIIDPYSDRLMTKVLSLNDLLTKKVNINDVEKAIYYAKKYHGNQKRDSGEPYYTHPLEVAYYVADYTAISRPKLYRTDIVVTSILHDCLEDTDLTKKMIKDVFDDQIAEQVYDLTRIKEDGSKISSSALAIKLWEENKHDMLLIKIFDRLHNMLTLSFKSLEKIKKTVDETFEVFIVLSASLGVPKLEKQLTELCYHYLSIEPKLLSWRHQQKSSFVDNFLPPFLISQNTISQIRMPDSQGS